MTYRVEIDLLGEMDIPADAYYGINTARALENFPITGRRVNLKLIREIILVKKAAVELVHLRT